MLCALIMAGGKGTRFWPLSTEEKPKQFLNLVGSYTMIQMTINRILPIIPIERVFVCTGEKYISYIKEQLPNLPDRNIIIEPEGRNTAPCIAVSSMIINKYYKDASVLVLPSDHLIEKEEAFRKIVLAGNDFINDHNECIITLGIEPSRAETGYGYIEMGERIPSATQAYKIARFTEKPNIEVAKDFLLKGTYLWNSGMFVFRADVILREIEKYLPKMYKSLMNIYQHLGEEDEEQVTREEYGLIDGISIDFGVMQRTRKAYVIKGDFKWDDIGSFNALSRYLNQYRNNNKISNNVYIQDCENCSIFGGDEKLIIGFGVKDLVVVDAGDVILVMDKDKDQEIKHLLNDINDSPEFGAFI